MNLRQRSMFMFVLPLFSLHSKNVTWTKWSAFISLRRIKRKYFLKCIFVFGQIGRKFQRF